MALFVNFQFKNSFPFINQGTDRPLPYKKLYITYSTSYITHTYSQTFQSITYTLLLSWSLTIHSHLHKTLNLPISHSHTLTQHSTHPLSLATHQRVLEVIRREGLVRPAAHVVVPVQHPLAQVSPLWPADKVKVSKLPPKEFWMHCPLEIKGLTVVDVSL